jgi:large subunit ribosomal protein L10
MDRAEKQEAIETLKGIFDNAGSVVVAQYSGLTVAEMTKLRVGLRQVGANVKVVKNRLAKIALKGKPGERASDLFAGPVAIAYSTDFVSAPKAVVEFAKGNDKFVILGGFMEEELLDAKGVEALSKMPSREELIATIAARLVGQASQVVGRLNAPGQHLAGAVQAIGEKAAA